MNVPASRFWLQIFWVTAYPQAFMLSSTSCI